MVAGLLRDEPDLATDVVFGARSVATLEDDLAVSLLRAWHDGRTSLRAPHDAALRLAS